MDIRKLVSIVAALCVMPAAFAQGTDGTTGGSTTGGSAGDGDRPSTYTRATFADLDKNKSGVLEKKEISASPLLSPAVVKKMDTNGDGVISEAEFESYQAMTSGNKVPSQ